MIGPFPYSLIHPEDAPNYEEARQKIASATGNEGVEWEARIKDAMGQWRWFHNKVVIFDRTPGGLPKQVLGIATDISARKRADQIIRQSEASMRRDHEDLRGLMASLLMEQEEERKRIARELHDDLNQKIGMLAFEAATLSEDAPDSREQIRERAGSIHARLKDLADDVRRTAYQLHLPAIEHLGLPAALESYCAEGFRESGVEVRFTYQDLPSPIPEVVGAGIYRITQEALQNVVRHSGAKEAKVELIGSNEDIRLSVTDPGVGFDLEAVRGKGGLGLMSIRERVEILGGKMFIETKPGGGTRLQVWIPVPQSPGGAR